MYKNLYRDVFSEIHVTKFVCLTTFCRLRHNRLLKTSQLPVNCEASAWKMISNSWDIDLFTATFTAGRVKIMVCNNCAHHVECTWNWYNIWYVHIHFIKRPSNKVSLATQTLLILRTIETKKSGVLTGLSSDWPSTAQPWCEQIRNIP